MSDIFISYAREDEFRIQAIVKALEEQGFSVFWDRHIPSGQTWRSYIGQALEEAGCVMAVWTVHSIVSDWVVEEADEGKKRDALVPVLLDRVDPPIGFRSLQASDLIDWQPEEPSPQFDQLVDYIKMALERSQSAPAEDKEAKARLGIARPRKQRTSWIKNPFWQWIIGIAIGIVGIIISIILSGKDQPEQAAKINGDQGTVVQLKDSPGARVEVTQAIDPEELAKQLAKHLPDQLSLSQKEEEIKALKETIERLKQDPSDELKQEALVALTKDDKAGATELLEQAARARTEKAESLNKQAAQDWIDAGNIAYLYDTQKALEAYKEASRLDPANPSGWNRLGHVLSRLGRLDEAQAAYEKVLGLAGDDKLWEGVAYGNLGIIYQTRGEMDQAEKYHRKALEIDEALGRKEGLANNYNNLAVIYRTRGELDRTEEYLRKALKIDEALGRKEGLASEYTNLGVIYQIRGEQDKTCEYWRKSLKLFNEIRAKDLSRKVGTWVARDCNED